MMDGRELVAAYFDNTLSPEDSARLAEWIARSPENARFFAEWSVLEDHVAEEYGVAELLRAEQRSLAQSAGTMSGARGRWGAWPWLSAAAVLVVGTLALVLAVSYWPTKPAPVVVQPGPGAEGAPEQYASVATLVAERGAVWEASSAGDADTPVPGGRLSAGAARLVEGVAHLRTDEGVDLIIEGPADFVFDDAQTLRLSTGRVFGDASSSAVPFDVKGDRLDLTGCDRSFAVRAEQDRTVFCQVYEGSGDVHVYDDAGEVEFVSRLMPNQSLTVDADGSVQVGRLDEAAFVRTLTVSQLAIGRDYVEAVRASGPTNYWRFEQLEGGDVPNDVQGQPALRIQSVGGGLGLSEDIQNRHLHRTDVTGEFLVTTERLTIDSDRYSIECWVRNDHADAWTTLFAFQVFPEARTELEFGLIQLEMLPAVEGDASAGHRFMLTHADEAGPFEHDLFTRADREPTGWHHIVVVRDGPQVMLYRDGNLWAKDDAPRIGPVMDVTIVVGRNGITPGGEYRLFRGSLDEFAIYDRPLTIEEVRSHYRALPTPRETQGEVR
ncbi:MAG: LamG-like jellyroll fold domain-containing protein [Phycisphaerales bacterium JB063]